MDLFSEVGLDMKVDISSLATQSQSTAPTSIRVIASPANPSSPNFKPQQISQFLLEKKEKEGDGEENNGWDDDDLDIWFVCSKEASDQPTITHIQNDCQLSSSRFIDHLTE